MNGRLVRIVERVEELRFGKMGLGTMGIGWMIKLMAMVDLSMQTETFMKGNGSTIKHME